MHEQDDHQAPKCSYGTAKRNQFLASHSNEVFPVYMPDGDVVFWKQNSPTCQDTAGVERINGLFGYALMLTRNRSEAEDLVQETYVRAIGAMGGCVLRAT
jgi:hypothetical protein